MIGRRILYQDQFGTVKYQGPILHENRGNGIWLGIEWDEPERGRHNGKVGDVTYFQTTGNLKSGSLLKKEKVDLGVNILDAVFLKYFKEIPKDLHGYINEDLISYLESQKTANEVEAPQSQMVTVASQKQVLVEFDCNAFFETMKKKKKMVEFYGFDVIWKRISNLQLLPELSLENLTISDVGQEAFLSNIMTNLRILSLELNLLYSWQQVLMIGKELKFLEELHLSQNVIRQIESIEELEKLSIQQEKQQEQQQENIQELETQQSMQQEEEKKDENKEEKLSQVSYVLENPNYRIFDLKQQRFTKTHPLQVFQNLKILVLINMKLTWKQITQIIPVFNVLEELILCRNKLVDYKNLFIKDGCLQQLKHLNLENTQNNDFSLIQQYFGDLNIENLIVNKNDLTQLCDINKFKTLQKLSFEGNSFNDCYFLSKLSALPKLISLNVKHNPIQNLVGRETVRQRAIAEISTLEWMNGSNLNKLERKDSEIYYLKSSFEDYFKKKNVPHYHYDYDDFLKYAQVEHPKINYLIKKFGVPYENDPTVKEKPKVKQVKTCTVNFKALTGKNKDKVVQKKLMLNTGIFPLKQIAGRLSGIPLKQCIVYAQATENGDLVQMIEGEDKVLEDYGIDEGSTILVDQSG